MLNLACFDKTDNFKFMDSDGEGKATRSRLKTFYATLFNHNADKNKDSFWSLGEVSP